MTRRDEFNETLTITLSTASPAVNVSRLPHVAVITIMDDDTPALAISAPDSAIEGTDTMLVFAVNASTPPKENLLVQLDISQTGGPFIATSGQVTPTLVFSGGSTATYTIAIDDDNADEADGSVTVALSKTGAQDYTVGTPANVTVALTDDDVPALSISAGAATIEEGENTVFTVTSSIAPMTNELEVVLNVISVGGSNFVDMYGHRTVTLTFNGGTSATYTLATNNDELDEPDGDLAVTLLRSPSDNYTVGDPATATVTVTDNDETASELTLSGPASIPEDEDAVFTITASPAPTEALTVEFLVLGEEGDFTKGSFLESGEAGRTQQTLTFTGGTATHTVLIDDDGVDELDGSVTLRLSKPVGNSQNYTVVGGTQTATVAIRDNDTPELTLSGPVSITEDMDAVFTITANPVPKRTLWVQLSISQTGSFLEPGQQRGPQPVLGFSTVGDGTAVATYTVAIQDDTINEADGSVTVTLTAISNFGPITEYTVDTTNNTATVSILDDDNIRLTIAADAPSVTERDQSSDPAVYAEFTITAGSVPASPLEVRLGVGGAGDFVADADLGIKTLTLDGVATATYTVGIVPDEIDEDDGMVTVSLLPPAMERAYAIGSPSSATVNVVDNDAATLSIAARASPITEGVETHAEYIVTAAGSGKSEIEVRLEVTEDTADGQSFVAVGTQTVTLTFTPSGSGESTAVYPVAIVDDGDSETDGAVTVEILSAVSGQDYSLGTPVSAAVNVNDDDSAAPTVTVADVTASEGAEALSFELVLGGAPARDATVAYAVTAGTATITTDFTGASGTLTFARGETASKFVTVSVVNDSDDEPHETVILTLSSPIHLTLADTTATGTILDDDGPEIAVMSHASRVNEDTSGPYVFSVGLRQTTPPVNPLTQPVTFDYSIGGGSATANSAGGVVGADYTVVGDATGRLTFAPGAGIDPTEYLTFTVEITNDDTNEQDEDFFFTLSNVDNAEIAGGFSSRDYGVTILDDDDLVF